MVPKHLHWERCSSKRERMAYVAAENVAAEKVAVENVKGEDSSRRNSRATCIFSPSPIFSINSTHASSACDNFCDSLLIHRPDWRPQHWERTWFPSASF